MSEITAAPVDVKVIEGGVELTIVTPDGPFIMGLQLQSAASLAAMIFQGVATAINAPTERVGPLWGGITVAKWTAAPMSDYKSAGLIIELETGGVIPLRFEFESVQSLAKALQTLCDKLLAPSNQKH